MKKMASIYVLFIAVSIILTSCGKESDKAEIRSSTTAQNSTSSMTEKNGSSTAPELAAAATGEAAKPGSATSMTIEKNPATPVESTGLAGSEQSATGNLPQETNPASASMDSKSATESKPDSALNASQKEMLALAQKSGCLACHNVDKKIVGPAWRDVSKRYKGVAQTKARLIEKISKGGRGNWTDVVGNAAMPPYFPRVSKENIEKLVDFVLSL